MRFFKKLIPLALMLSFAGTAFCQSKKSDIPKPPFSWDRVPVYQMFGDSKRLLNEEEVKQIGDTTSFLCIEKIHGRRTLGGAELGAAHEFKRFKKDSPKTSCLFYFNSAYAYPFTSATEKFAHGKVSPEYLPFLLKDLNKDTLANRGNIYYFDVLNPDLRKWWSKQVGDYVRETGADGLFVDQMHGFIFLRPREDRPLVKPAQAEMMRMAKNAIGPDKILLLNNGAHIPELFEIGDAFMFEHYAAKFLTKEAILADWQLMEKISTAGKSSVWRIGVEVEHEEEDKKIRQQKYMQLAREHIDYYLAAFLIGAQEHSYFQYGWGWKLTTGPLLHHPEFDLPLGKPLDARVRTSPKGWVFTRRFKHADVQVDLEKKPAVFIGNRVSPNPIYKKIPDGEDFKQSQHRGCKLIFLESFISALQRLHRRLRHYVSLQ